MPHRLPESDIQAADAAVAFAQQVRRFHRRRTDRRSVDRTRDVELAIQRLADAMTPLRSEIARFPRGPQTDAAERNRQIIREKSEAIQVERRKLWKMLPR